MSAFDLHDPNDLKEATSAVHTFERDVVQAIADLAAPFNPAVVIDVVAWGPILKRLEDLINSPI